MERRRMGQRKMCIYLLDALCHSPIEQCEININETFSLSPSSGFANIPIRYRSAKRFSFFKKTTMCTLLGFERHRFASCVSSCQFCSRLISNKMKIQSAKDIGPCSVRSLCVSPSLPAFTAHLPTHCTRYKIRYMKTWIHLPPKARLAHKCIKPIFGSIPSYSDSNRKKCWKREESTMKSTKKRKLLLFDFENGYIRNDDNNAPNLNGELGEKKRPMRRRRRRRRSVTHICSLCTTR